MLNQLGLSITATVAATLIVTAIQHESSDRHPLLLHPELTSGGKFAARIEALRVAAAASAPIIPPAPVPVLVSDASLRTIPITLVADPSPAEAPKAAAEPGKILGRRMTHADGRRRFADNPIEVAPPRRSDNLVETMTATPVVTESGASKAWGATKGLYLQAVSMGSEALDRVNPMNLLR